MRESRLQPTTIFHDFFANDYRRTMISNCPAGRDSFIWWIGMKKIYLWVIHMMISSRLFTERWFVFNLCPRTCTHSLYSVSLFHYNHQYQQFSHPRMLLYVWCLAHHTHISEGGRSCLRNRFSCPLCGH